MGVKAQPVLDAGELNNTDEQILDLLHAGRVTPPYAAAELDKSREYTSERLIRLKEHKHVRRIAPGLYELVDDPRDDVDAGADLDAARDAFHELIDARERLDQQAIDEAFERLADALGVIDDG